MDRSKIVVPRVHPGLATSQAAAKTLGLRTQKAQDDKIRDAFRYGRDKGYNPVTFVSYTWTQPGIGPNLTIAGNLLYHTGSGTFGTSGTNQRMACPGKIIGGFLELNTNWTVGNIYLTLYLDNALEVEWDDLCTIDGSDVDSVRNASFCLPYEIGYDFAEGQMIRAGFVTSANWPTSPSYHVRGSFLVAYDG